MSRDPPTRMLRLIEAEGSTAVVVRAVHGRQFSRHRRHSVLQCTEEPMFDTLTPRSTTSEFKTMPCARPDPGGFLP